MTPDVEERILALVSRMARAAVEPSLVFWPGGVCVRKDGKYYAYTYEEYLPSLRRIRCSDDDCGGAHAAG